MFFILLWCHMCQTKLSLQFRFQLGFQWEYLRYTEQMNKQINKVQRWFNEEFHYIIQHGTGLLQVENTFGGMCLKDKYFKSVNEFSYVYSCN